MGDRHCFKFQSGDRERTKEAAVCPVAGVHSAIVRVHQYRRKPGDEPDNFRYDE